MVRALPLVLLALLLPAAAQAATVKVPVPADGQVAVAVASVSKASKVKARGPAALAVTGAVKKGRLAVAVVRRRGVAASGAVTITVKGKVRGMKRYGAALGGDRASGAACKGLEALLARPLRRAGIADGDLRAVGQAAGARLCGRAAPAAAADVLARLGLGAGQPGGGLVQPLPQPPPPAGDGTTNECSNGIDDDGDGQVDAASERLPRPDPGCMNANDRSENSEVPLQCDAGAGVSDDGSVLQIGINGCGEFVEVAVYAAPNAFVCDIGAAAGNWVCLIAHGHAFAETRNAIGTDTADLQISLNAAADCSVPVTIALTRRTFEVAELVGDDWC